MTGCVECRDNPLETMIAALTTAGASVFTNPGVVNRSMVG